VAIHFKTANSDTTDRRVSKNVSMIFICALSSVALLFVSVPKASAAREFLEERLGERLRELRASTGNIPITNVAGLQVACWVPKKTPAPLVIFSHGFRGSNKQSVVTMKALADAGYYVIAPNHQDSMATSTATRPQAPFGRVSKWDENTYKDRGEDIKRLFETIKNDPRWQQKVDFSKVALMGHSLGGYTMLGLSGAWPSWKLDGIKAVVALSPYLNPYAQANTLKNIDIPIMYQSGTMDFGVEPFLLGPGGAFSKTNSPAYLVDIKGANHFTWTVLNRQKAREDLIDHYCISFLNKYVQNDAQAKPEEKLPGLAALMVK